MLSITLVFCILVTYVSCESNDSNGTQVDQWLQDYDSPLEKNVTIDISAQAENSTNMQLLPPSDSALGKTDDVSEQAENSTEIPLVPFPELDSEKLAIGILKCDSTEMCTGIADTVCKEGICQCQETHVPSLDNETCLRKATKPGDMCQINKQCGESGGNCVEGRCQIVIRTAQMIEGRPKDQGSSVANTKFSSASISFIASIIALVSSHPNQL